MSQVQLKLFFSYSHKDEKLRDELANHLSTLTRLGVIDSWYDRKIPPGKEWDKQISENLSTADIILLLVSADFIASDYCWDVEVQTAIARHDKGEARVIPVILRDVDWKDTLFAKIQFLPKDAQAVTSWSNQDAAFKNVAQGIRDAVQDLIRERQQKQAIANKKAALAQYRRKVEEFAADGEISQIDAHILQEEQSKLGLTDQEAESIRKQVLEPYGIYKENLDKYRQFFTQLVEAQGYPLGGKAQADLRKLQNYYSLKDEDIARIEQEQNVIEQQNQQKLRKEQERAEYERLQTELNSKQRQQPSTPQIQTQFFEFDTATVTVKSSGILGLGKSCIVNRRKSRAEFFNERLDHGINLEMVAIPGGQFFMGSPESESGYHQSQSPQHHVKIQPFFMGKFPVTQAQWRVVAAWDKVNIDLDPDPSRFKGDNRPVERVSWDDAVEFCQRLSKRTNQTYRLPSEAEWEYACRAGTTTPFCFGETITTDLVNYDGNYTYGAGSKGEYREQTTDVGKFPANLFGLYDLHGNVWEWCEDVWHDSYNGAPSDGSAWMSNSSNHEYRLLRGGSWYYNPGICRSAGRGRSARDIRDYIVGFRVVIAVFRT